MAEDADGDRAAFSPPQGVPASASLPPQTSMVTPNRLVGHVVYLFAFDVAYEMIRQPVATLLGQPVAQFVVDASKRNPRQLFFYRPQMVRLPPIERLGPRGMVRLERSIKLLPVGAISVMVRVPFDVQKLEDLVPYHDLRFSDGVYLYDEVRALADEVRHELASYFIRPTAELADEEAYTIFCIDAARSGFGRRSAGGGGENVRSEDWLKANRPGVAALLTEEDQPQYLSDQEAEESTSRYFSYYDQDLVVVDWDAAVVIDEPRYFDEVLYLMELANVQLAELEAYDRILDSAVDRSYRDLSARRITGLGFRRTARVQRELREIRIDLTRLSDELSNITKFFGDWHLARIYQGLSDRFHLSEWHRTIDEKLKTVDDLYQLLRHDQTNRWMLILEVTIVVLFIIDVIILLTGIR
jgi:hypothetical protein